MPAAIKFWPFRTTIDGFLEIASGVSAFALIIWVMYFCSYGIDFTDDSYYAIWLSVPYNYDWSLSQYGFFYHPLHKIFGGDIAMLRRANALVTVALGWLLFAELLRQQGTRVMQSAAGRWLFAFGFAPVSLVLFMTWLITPNYNTLAFQGLAVTAFGLAATGCDESGARRRIGWIVLGLGGWIVFMAKPSSLLILGPLVFGFLLLAGRFEIRGCLIAAVTAICALLTSAMVIDGSLARFADRMMVAKSLIEMLGGHHSIANSLRWDDTLLNQNDYLTIAGLATPIVVAAVLLQAQSLWSRLLGVSICALGIGWLCAVIAGVERKGLTLSTKPGLMLWSIPLAAVAIIVLLRKGWRFSGKGRTGWSMTALLIAMPYAFAFGTNNNYRLQQSWAGAFWVMAAAALLVTFLQTERLLRILPAFAIGSQLLAAWLIQQGIEAPYRQPHSLRENRHPTTLAGTGTVLMLADDYSRYIKEARDKATNAGFRPGMPIIDLSGQSPGMALALGAISPGQAWHIGGYPGSDALSRAALLRAPCEQLAGAWILEEPGGPRRLSSEVLKAIGADLESDFTPVGTWMTAKGAGGYPQARQQRMLKPTRPQVDATRACEAARRSQTSG